MQTSKSTVSDRDGNFILKNITLGDSVIITSISYKTQKIKIDSLIKSLTISLEKSHVDLKEVIINAQYNNLTTTHALSLIDLDRQPVRSAQDLMRLIPGLFIAQHQGGGKAEQIFLRGFDADHGTDVNVSVDGIPVNMVSHAHGQGYADLHFLIPETVASYDFGKGPYYANKGDFCTAGYVAYNTIDVLNKNMVKLEGGQFDNFRAVALINLLSKKAKEKQQSAYIAGEGLYFNGPFDYPEHFNRFNLFGKFITPLSADTKLTLELSMLSSGWRASGEIPNRTVAEGYIPNRFGALDSAQGGYTSRTNASVKLISSFKNDFIWENQFWYSYYYFNLITNFTFFYYYPTTGDEFRQHEIRDLSGYNTKLYKQVTNGSTTFTSEAGAGFRYDHINPSELDHTMNGNFLSYLQYGKTQELNADAYFNETITKGNWLFNTGVRFDYFHFYYLNMAPASDTFATKIYDIPDISPNAQKAILSPKLNVQYTFNPHFQLYIKSGKGFHSNDARVVIANQGYAILPAAYGVDLGTNWKPFPRFFINDAFWYLYLQEEFTFGQDLINQPGGPVQPSGKTRREGNDFSARYQLNSWLFASMNLNFANPKFIDSTEGHDHIPLAPTFTSTAGLDFRFKNGLNGSISYRYLHNRAANSTYTLIALGYWVTDLTVNYTKKNYEVGLAIENLFNVVWNESQFEYTSRLKYETQPVDEVSYTPGTPIFAKLKLAVFF